MPQSTTQRPTDYTAPVADEVPTPRPGSGDDDEVSLLEIANAVLRGRRLIVATAFLVSFVVAVRTYFDYPVYTSTIAFAPANGAPSSSLSSLAAQFGVSLGGASAGPQAPEFYAALVLNRQFLQPIAADSFTFIWETDTTRKPFAQLQGIEEDTPAQTLDLAITALSDMLVVSTDATTGVVTVTAYGGNPVMATEIAARVLASVDSFAANLRQERIAAERRFVEERLQTSRAELNAAEYVLQRFLESNRAYASDPRLQFEYERLQREVTLRQTIYTSLRQGLEQARIESDRTTPAITVVQTAQPPLVPVKKQLKLKVIVAFIAGAVIGLGISVVRDFLQRSRSTDRQAMNEFARLVSAAVTDLRRLPGATLRFFRHLPRNVARFVRVVLGWFRRRRSGPADGPIGG